MEKLEPSAYGNVKCCTEFDSLKKLNVYQLFDPAVVFLGIYPTEVTAYVRTETYSPMFMVTLFVIAKIGHYLNISR